MLFIEPTCKYVPNGHHQRFTPSSGVKLEDFSDILLDNFSCILKGRDCEEGSLWRRGCCRWALVTALSLHQTDNELSNPGLCWLALPSQAWHGRGTWRPSCSQHHLPPASTTKLSANFQLHTLNFQGGLEGAGKAVLG